VLPGRIEAELIVKGDYTVDIYLWYTKKVSNLQHSFPGKIAKLALNLL